jgi:nucleotide-binding universal stress UspA family protein
MACVINTDLAILHVCPIPVVLNEVPVPPYTLLELVDDAEQKMIPLKQKIESRTGKKIKVNTLVKTGELISGINEFCNLVDTYAVVMSVEDSSAFDRFLFGSKTISAIKQLEWPIIAVPGEVKFTNIQKIGLACDFRKVVETIPVEEIKRLVNNFNAELYVLHVSPQNNLFSKEIDEESEWLQSMLNGLHPIYHFINGNDIEKGIAEFAEKIKLDLLITIPKKHNFISKIFQHSHSKELVLHSHVPVMSIHE